MHRIISDHKSNSVEVSDLPLPEFLLNKIMLSTPALVAIIDSKDFGIIYTNELFEKVLKYDKADISLPGFSFLNILDESQHERLKAQLNSVNDSIETSADFTEFRIKTKDGERREVNIYAARVNDDDSGKCYYYLLMHPNLSKWSVPFTSLDTMGLFLEQFASEQFGTFEWYINPDKYFLSDGIYQIYEISEDKYHLNPKYIFGFTHPDDTASLRELINKALVDNTEVNAQYKIITAKHNVKTIHLLGKAMANAEGKPEKFIGSIRDITEQRRIEQDLKNNIEELNKSNKELEEFAYTASHDMQEPLRKITTFSNMLSEKYKDLLTGDGKMYLERVVASAENMRLLINNLLDFSHISKAKESFTPVNLNFILHQVKIDLELVIEETGAIITSPILPTIDALMPQMKQLFTNLINNSIKFHKLYNKPVINITTAIATTEEKARYGLAPSLTYYKIEFTDNGIGFESEYAARIFQIFQRLHGKSEYPGSGVGLAICKKIVEHHHGIIYARSTQGEGAVFTFILPEKQT